MQKTKHEINRREHEAIKVYQYLYQKQPQQNVCVCVFMCGSIADKANNKL